VLTRLRGALVAALIERDAQAVRRVATVLGVTEQLGSASRAMLLRPPDGVDAGQVRRRVVAGLQRQHVVVADGPWNRALVIIAAEPDGGAADLAVALDGLAAIAGWHVAIGSRATHAAGVSDSIEDAITALRFVRREGERPERPVVVLFDDVQAETLLTGDARRAAALIAHHLGPILDDADLMETLAAFVDTGGSTKRTAERLFLHPNSVTYRLNKISGRLGRDPRDFADLVDLALAVRTHTAVRLAGQDDVSGS
jgi:DNA-binding PucR family transcriptional regulator